MVPRLQQRLTALAVASALSWTATDGSPADPPQSHWAYQPLGAFQPPAAAGSEARQPVDAFIRHTLASAGGRPAPEADRRTLIRRVTFDLVGLPPTPEAIEAFVADPAPDAYERLVDRLLASPQHGERWARLWMDAVHFAETHGHDQDRIRTNAWPYRDYLIAAFNGDRPYARFLQEQVAGDVLFPGDPQATVALGFLAAGPWDESSLRDIREDTLDRQIARYLDRDDMITTVMSVAVSSTVHCARCHDHKFDPISQRDYYALQAVFSGVDRANRAFDPDPAHHRRRQELRQQQRQVTRRDAALLDSPETRDRIRAWEEDQQSRRIAWTALEPQTFVATSGVPLVRQPDQSLLAGGERPDRDTYLITAASPVATVTAVRLDVLTDPSLPQAGPGRADNGNLHLSEVLLRVFEPGTLQGADIAMANPGADFSQQGWPIGHALDRDDTTAWAIHPRVGEAHHAVFPFATPVHLREGSMLVCELRQVHGGGHVIGRLRLSVTDQASASIVALPVAIEALLDRPESERTQADRLELAAWVLGREIEDALAALPPPALVYAAAADFEPDGGLKPTPGPRPVSLLRRGEITQPLEPAQPGTLHCLPPLPSRFELTDPSDEGSRRAALAAWLTADANVLTWRSVVNRVWRHHFGRGLAASLNDFGVMGSPPSHPELLDWLALWFRDEAQGSLKQLHRLLVTSATYRQSCTTDPEAAALDPENRLLSRMHRSRLDAECIRDAMLSASGRLDPTMGGPSDRQFGLEPGIHVTPKVDYAVFDVDAPAGSRRSVYRFLFRTLPDPFMDALDCPAGDQLTPERANSVTVQQALALWNDRFAVRQAEHLAARIEAEADTVPARVARACLLAWGRPPALEEAQDLEAHTARHGFASTCRLLFNSNEFVFVH